MVSSAKSSATMPTKKPRLTKSGQHTIAGGGCISTTLKGKPCANRRTSKGVPYCKVCQKTGDPSLMVCCHPKYGKILAAARALPKGYYVAWWGALTPVRKLAEKKHEWALKTTIGMIDATRFKGAQLLFCACPGPKERATINFSPNSTALLSRKPLTSMIFHTLCAVPKKHQLTMLYNIDEKTTEQFFSERGLVRANVGTARFPALLK
eukprot:TRINITY_DN7176_c0_g1_i1.p1 TRINITY_DN7176_c0_g1~~TRINITY_DN7176_c0_g1_i1.p1  ORF type:complete len:208 (+),score=24.74 TRINITY_DN7176_c0_g1_i1:87-710(+)